LAKVTTTTTMTTMTMTTTKFHAERPFLAAMATTAGAGGAGAAAAAAAAAAPPLRRCLSVLPVHKLPTNLQISVQSEHEFYYLQQRAEWKPTSVHACYCQPYARASTPLFRLGQPLFLHLVQHCLLLMLAAIVPEQPSLEGGPRASEVVSTAAIGPQMRSEDNMPVYVSHLSRSAHSRRKGSEIGTVESKQRACAIVAFLRGEVKR
jgi:hypothetical protein